MIFVSLSLVNFVIERRVLFASEALALADELVPVIVVHLILAHHETERPLIDLVDQRGLHQAELIGLIGVRLNGRIDGETYDKHRVRHNTR